MEIIITAQGTYFGPIRNHVRHFKIRSQNFEKKLLASSCLSVRPSVRINNSASNEKIFIKSDIWVFFEILLR